MHPVPLALFLLCACGTPEQASPSVAPVEPARQTIVVITLDTTRADRIGCYGYALAETPHLDRLAARGTRFARAYAPAPLTIPSHATLFTGLLPPHHGLRDNGDQRLADQAFTLAEQLHQAGWHTHASVTAFVTQAHWGFGQGFVGFDDDLGVPSDRLSWRAERDGASAVDDALAALEAGADFLWLHLFEPHAPYQPPEPFRSRHQGRPYDGEIATADHQVGRLLAALPEDALVVLAGDHGEGLGDGGELQHGLLLGDATLHVPLIIAGPDIPVRVVDRPVSLADVTPTLLRLQDLPVDPSLDGTDLFEPAPRTGVYAETHYGANHYGWASLHAIIGERGRVVRGSRDENEGEVGEELIESLEAATALQPLWQASPVTLDLAQVEQLQALGYLAAPPTAGGTDHATDPRDGIQDVQRFATLGELAPAEQERALRELLVAQPAFRDARFRLSLLLSRSGRLDEAMAEMATLYEHTPDSTAAVAMGEIWLQAGDPGEALHWFREALQHDPRSATARAGEIDSLASMGMWDEAKAHADLALDQTPDHGTVQAVRALLASRDGEPLGHWPDTLALLAEQRPYDPRLPQAAARLLAAAGRPEEAIDRYRQELRWRPYNMTARLELYDLFVSHGRQVDALKTLRPLRALQPEEPRWRALTAQSYLAMDRPDLAEPHLVACQGDPACPQLETSGTLAP